MTEVIARVWQRPYLLLGGVGLLVALGVLLSGTQQIVFPKPRPVVLQSITGTALLVLIFYQVVLLFVRLGGSAATVRKHYMAHRWVGAASGFLFLVHVVRPGYGWTSALFWVFILAAGSGLLNREVMRYRSRGVYDAWMFIHTALALSLLPLSLIHVWIALLFEPTL